MVPGRSDGDGEDGDEEGRGRPAVGEGVARRPRQPQAPALHQVRDRCRQMAHL